MDYLDELNKALDQVLKNIDKKYMKMTPEQLKDFCVQFTAIYNNITPIDLECILETLDDMEMLNDSGKEFRHAYWEMFIEEKKSIEERQNLTPKVVDWRDGFLHDP